MKKNFLYFLLLLSAFIIPLIGCNTISDSVSKNNSSLIQNQVEKNYKIDTVFFLTGSRGHTVDFEGTLTSTLTENGSITSDTVPIYRRITCLGDTVLDLTDSIYGLMEFRMGDVTQWDSLFSKIKYRNGLVGVIIAEYLNPYDLQIIDSTDSSQFLLLSDSTKKSVITTLNNIVNIDDLYFNYREEIEIDVYFIPVRDSLYADILRLVGENIFLDTAGRLQSNLSSFQQEKLKWFNWRIFVRYLDSRFNAVDNKKLFNYYSTAGQVFGFLFQQGSTPADFSKNEVIRFISKRSDGLYQIAYQDEYGFSAPKDKKITGFPYVCDMGWTVAPLLWLPKTPFIETNSTPSLLNQGKATLKYTSFIIDTFSGYKDTTWYYDLKLLYPLTGTVMKNDEPVRIAGTLNTTFGFFKSSIKNRDMHRGYFTRWDTEIEILGIFKNESIIKYNETYALQSDEGPNGEYF